MALDWSKEGLGCLGRGDRLETSSQIVLMMLRIIRRYQLAKTLLVGILLVGGVSGGWISIRDRVSLELGIQKSVNSNSVVLGIALGYSIHCFLREPRQ